MLKYPWDNISIPWKKGNFVEFMWPLCPSPPHLVPPPFLHSCSSLSYVSLQCPCSSHLVVVWTLKAANFGQFDGQPQSSPLLPSYALVVLARLSPDKRYDTQKRTRQRIRLERLKEVKPISRSIRSRSPQPVDQRMQQQGVKLNLDALINIVNACTSRAALVEGRLIHASIIDRGLESNICIGTALIKMYGRFNALQGALTVFDKMTQQNVISWTAMMTIYANEGHEKEALKLYQQMEKKGLKPSKVTFIIVLRVCSSLAAPEEGKTIHSCLVASGYECDLIVETALLSMYGKCGVLQDAHRVFDKMPLRDVISWNALMTVYVEQGHYRKALQIYEHMLHENMKPNKVTFISILSACCSLSALAEGQAIHTCIAESTFQPDVVVRNALINMYGKCGAVEDARSVFDNMANCDMVSWNTMIDAYTEQGHGKEALQLLWQMPKKHVKPDRITYVSTLNACANLAALTEGQAIHACTVDGGLELDVVIGTALMNLYGKCGAMEEARVVFEKIPERDLVCWNVMISVYHQQGDSNKAIALFWKMLGEGMEPDEVTFACVFNACAILTDIGEGCSVHSYILNHRLQVSVALGTALINMYARCGFMQHALSEFDRLDHANAVSWNAMITAYTQQGYCLDALNLFQQMQMQGVKPDKITFAIILGACASINAIVEANSIHSSIVDSGFETDVVVGTALVNMYSKCGAFKNACSMFDRMHTHNVVSWTAIIDAYAQCGYARGALRLLSKMQQVTLKPNDVTFISLLSACSHAGLVEEGFRCFVSMSEDHGIAPRMEHYVCMVDLLGRAGKLDEAEDFIRKMPLDPDIRVWSALLAACKIHDSMKHGTYAAEQLFDLDAGNAGLYVLLSNLYAGNDRWDDLLECENDV